MRMLWPLLQMDKLQHKQALHSAQADSAFEEAKYAANTNRVKASLWQTWHNICAMRMIVILPLDVDTMNQVCFVLKSAGYKSGASYLYEARQRRIKAGFPWSQRLEIAVRDCKRALEPHRVIEDL